MSPKVGNETAAEDQRGVQRENLSECALLEGARLSFGERMMRNRFSQFLAVTLDAFMELHRAEPMWRRLAAVVRKALIAIVVGALALAVAGFGCASERPKPSSAATPDSSAHELKFSPPKVRFGEFRHVELKETSLVTNCVNSRNQGFARRIDRQLLARLQALFPDVKTVANDSEFSKGGERTLQIEPAITRTRAFLVNFHGTAGATPDESNLVLHVCYRDSASGEIIAEADFWREVKLAAIYESSVNNLPDGLAAQVAGYTRINK